MRDPLNYAGKFAEPWRAIRLPLIVAGATRLGLLTWAYFSSGTRVMTQGDTASYLEPGRQLFLHASFMTAGVPEIDRTPGYPIFLMLTGMLDNSVVLVVLTQVLLSLLSITLVWRICKLVFRDPGAGVAAAWLFALEPTSILYSVRLMPETLFVFLLLIVVERVLTFQQSGRLILLVWGGGALAAATYVKPVSYYLVIPMAVGLAMTAPRRDGLIWKAPAWLLLTTLPWLAAWQVRNAHEAGYRGFSSIVDKNLYFYQAAGVSAKAEGIDISVKQIQLGYLGDESYLERHPEQRSWSRTQRFKFMRMQATQVMKDHPVLALASHFAGVGVVMFTPCATEFLQLVDRYPADGSMPGRILSRGVYRSLMEVLLYNPAAAVGMSVFEGYLLVLYTLSAVGLLYGHGGRLAVVAIVGTAAYLVLISGGAQAVGRYRLPVMPLICVMAGAGAVEIQKKRRSHCDSAVTVGRLV